MTDEEFKRMKDLHSEYLAARRVCDPIDFAQKQKDLLYVVCQFLLKPFHDEAEKRAKENRNDE